jgi:predicted O-methyltransferase YrrM
MKIIKNDVRKINLDYFDNQKDMFPHLIEPDNHFRFLTYISKLYDNILILDLGTLHGFSCISLAQNLNNKVQTYDISTDRYFGENLKSITEKYNVIYKNMDANSENGDVLNSAKIIFLDIDPHEGSQEIRFYEKLLQINFKGILLCDDIRLNDGMKNFWNRIEKEKYDLSDIGHWSGTGLVNFSDEKIEII